VKGEGEALALAEKVLAILELGSFSATYKYALFTAILDLCIEKTSAGGVPPSVITTAELARKVVELYWPHATPYDGKAVLRQGGVRAGNQAEIVRAIESFRTRHAGASGDLLYRARTSNPRAWQALLDQVEWKLVEMPIPRLQVSGGGEDRFLYEYGWSQNVTRSQVAAYQSRERGDFDNCIRLQPGVAEGLLRLNGILRPILRREWASMVASMNGLPESRLEEFLFGASRIPLGEVRGPLAELQAGRCFYCDDALRGASDVDHFIPWARHPDNGLDNLVVAHDRCNNRKRDFLAAAGHVERWAARNVSLAGQLGEAAVALDWEREPARSRAVALATYSRLEEGAKVWMEGTSLVGLEKGRVVRALEGWG
jgi:5-methylcytosine-specific restriction endonuclease McrA